MAQTDAGHSGNFAARIAARAEETRPLPVEAPNARPKRFAILWAALGVLLVIAGCKSAGDTGSRGNGQQGLGGGGGGDDKLCTNPTDEGCACAKPGATIDCGVEIHDGNLQVECSMGKQTCQADHTWGACVGDTVTTRPKAHPVAAGAQTDGLGTNVVCANNPCDPYCQQFNDTPTGLTPGTGLAVTPSGLSLTQGMGTPTGVCGPPLPTLGLGNLQCFQSTCLASQNGGNGTSVSGHVYDPIGEEPLYNVLVYVPNAALSAFVPGLHEDTCTSLVSGSPLVSTLTDATGSFTLANVPVGNGIPLVIQSGRWRRQFLINVTSSCANNPIAGSALSFPTNHTSPGPCPQGAGDAPCGDLPQFAVSTGNEDATECLLLHMGISSTEFTAPGPANQTWGALQGGRVHVYQHNGGYVSGSPSATELFGSPAMEANYQAIISPSVGYTWNFSSEWGAPIGVANGWDQYLVNYTNAGGRLFTSVADSWALIEQVGAYQPGSLWYDTQNWDSYGPEYEPLLWYINGVPDYDPFSVSMPYAVDATMNNTLSQGAPSCGEYPPPTFVPGVTFPQGTGLTTWLNTVGALSGGQLYVTGWRHVVNSANYPVGIEWMHGNTATSGDYPSLSGLWCVYNGDYDCCNGDDAYYCGCGGWEFAENPQLGYFTPGAGPDSLLTTFDTPINGVYGTVAAPAGACSNNANVPCSANAACAGLPAPASPATGTCDPAYYGRVVQTGMKVSESSAGLFPSYCSGAALEPQEKALEFMLFQATSCATNDTLTPVTPPAPKIIYNSATYTRDYNGICAPGTGLAWRYFDYTTLEPLGVSTPTSTKIVFTVQSAATEAALASAPVAQLGTANSTTPNSPADSGTAPTACTGITGWPNDVDPQLRCAGSTSQPWVRVTMVLDPSSDQTVTPTLESWQQNYDCVPDQ